MEDVAWFRHDGAEMTDDDWENGFARSVGVFMNGDTIQATDLFGARMVDDTFFVIVNASELDLPWTLPDTSRGRRWVIEFDSAEPDAGTPHLPSGFVDANAEMPVPAHTIIVLRRTDRTPAASHPSRRTKP